MSSYSGQRREPHEGFWSAMISPSSLPGLGRRKSRAKGDEREERAQIALQRAVSFI